MDDNRTELLWTLGGRCIGTGNTGGRIVIDSNGKKTIKQH